MADVGLGSDEVDRNLAPQLPLPEIRVEDERHFIRRTEAGSPLGGPENDWTGIFKKRLVEPPGLLSMVYRADRLSVAAGTQPRHRREIQLRAGGDDEIVVRHFALRRNDSVLVRLDPLRRRMNELDALFLQHRRQGKTDVLACSPPDRHPGIRRHEMEIIDIGDHRDLMLLIQQEA